MRQIPITQVRFNETEGRQKLERFLSRDRYTADIVPRGIAPSFVSAFIRERLTSESGPEVYFRALELMQFYELQDVLVHLRSPLRGERHPEERDALLRAACVLEAIGDFGTQNEMSQAVVYLDQLLSTHPAVIDAFATLNEAIIALVSSSSLQRLGQRLSDRVARAAQLQYENVDRMREYQTLLSLQRSDLPKVEFVLDAKRKLLSMPQPQRRSPLVATYLKRTLFSSVQMEVWAARLLRLEAMRDDPQPVYAEFARAMDTADQELSNKQLRAFVIERAAQAIIYLQGTLSTKHGILYYEVNRGTPNFLWDDL